MIVREILNQPGPITSFDFFNDTKDTLEYLFWVNTPESLAKAKELEVADRDYWYKQRSQPVTIVDRDPYSGCQRVRAISLPAVEFFRTKVL
jgi:hypothetical protein